MSKIYVNQISEQVMDRRQYESYFGKLEKRERKERLAREELVQIFYQGMF